VVKRQDGSLQKNN